MSIGRPTAKELAQRRADVMDWFIEAVADRWDVRATYDGNEPVDRAATRDRDGFHAQVLMRDIDGTPAHNYESFDVSIWGPDGLAIRATFPYNWSRIVAGETTCSQCGETGVKTVRVGFAGRSCEKCAPAYRAKVETRGWTS